MNRRIFYFLLIVGVISLIFILFFLLRHNNQTDTNPGSQGGIAPLPTSSGGTSVGGVDEDNNATDNEINRRSSLVMKLIDKSPHAGTNFYFYYSFKDNLFILYINPSAKDEANAEFDNFLKENGVLSRAWIDNLFISYISPTPSISPGAESSITPAP